MPAAFVAKTINVTAAAQAAAHIKDMCENLKCSAERNLSACSECKEECKKGLLSKIKPYTFTLFIKRYGIDELLDCLERNEKNGIIYHREGIIGDYDSFDDP